MASARLAATPSARDLAPADVAANVVANSAADGSLAVALDRALLARYTLGDGALEREVLELFAGHATHYLERLRAAQTRESWVEAAHTIKGSALAVGARRLARLAALAEQIDIVGDATLNEVHREQALQAVATATAEACHIIAGIVAKA